MILSFRNFFCAMVICSLGLASFAEGSDSRLCDESIEIVAASSFVPREVLYKIARLESGRHMEGRHVSWPWSLNNGGKGYFLKDSATALSTLSSMRAKGKTNIDVGCMQLNIRWHADFFDSLQQMMNPLDNVRYAASYLEKLYKETGSWEKTIKFYHSRNAKFNSVYYAKYKKIKSPDAGTVLASLRSNKTGTSFKNATIQSSNTSLFWTSSTGVFLQIGDQNGSSQAFSDIRNFSVPPLLKM